MKQVIFSFLFFLFLHHSVMAGEEPCPCQLPVTTITESGASYEALVAYASWAVNVHKVQMDMCKKLLANKNITGKSRESLQKASNTFSSTYSKLVSIKKKISGIKKMKQAEYTNFIVEISGTNLSGLKSANFFWKKKPKPPMNGDCGEDYRRPDCSSEAGAVNSECANGVNIMADCGFYSENGGAAAMQSDLEACGISSQNMMQMCMAAVEMCQPFQGSMVRRDFVEDAYSVCSQLDDDRMNLEPGQTQTSTGN